MTQKVKGVLQRYKEEIIKEMQEELWDEYRCEMAKKLNGKLSPEEIAKVTGLTLKTVLLL